MKNEEKPTLFLVILEVFCINGDTNEIDNRINTLQQCLNDKVLKGVKLHMYPMFGATFLVIETTMENLLEAEHICSTILQGRKIKCLTKVQFESEIGNFLSKSNVCYLKARKIQTQKLFKIIEESPKAFVRRAI